MADDPYKEAWKRVLREWDKLMEADERWTLPNGGAIYWVSHTPDRSWHLSESDIIFLRVQGIKPE